MAGILAQWRSALRERFASASLLSWSMYLGDRDVDGGEHEAPSWIVSVIVSLAFDEAGDRPAVPVRERANAGSVSATLVKQEKAPDELWQLC